MSTLHGLLAVAAVAASPIGKHCPWTPGQMLTLSGSVIEGGLSGSVIRRITLGDGRLFEHADLGIVSEAHGFDGRLAWTQDVSGATHELNSSFARALAVTQAWLDGHQGCRPVAGLNARRLEPQSDAGRRFAVWRVTPRHGAPVELWYDATTGQLDRAKLQLPETRLIRHFEDWRDIGGGRFAAFIERDEFPEDEDQIVYRFSRATIASRPGAADFRKPPPPHDARIMDPRGVASVPFEDDHRTRIYVPVYLNGQGPFPFELDNGGHFIVSEETAKAVGLKPEGSFNSTGAGDTVTKSGFARVASLKIGAAELIDQPARIRALPAAANDRGRLRPRAGLVGLELFERFVVSIDQRAKTVTLHLIGSPYRKPEGAPVQFVFAEDAPLIAGAYSSTPGDFMLDTGNAGATIIEDFWSQANGLTDRLRQGTVLGAATLSQGDLELGPFHLPGELVSYYGPAARGSEYSRAEAGIYGEPLLSRFNATYDYGRGTVWLDPLPEIAAVPLNRAGLSLVRSANGLLGVAAVAARSPAADAGIAVGDLVSELDGQPASKLSRADSLALFQQSAGTLVEARIGAGNAARTVILKLRDLSGTTSR